MPSHGLDHRRVDSDGAAAEHLAAELQQHAAKSRTRSVGAFP
jgi:hypothetical protein